VNNVLDAAKILAESSRLPTIPAVAHELLSISEWEDVDLREVAEIISKDVSLSSRVLQVVNSPFYGFPRQVSSISNALVILGLRATRSLTLSFSILTAAPKKKTRQFDYAGFWTRSLNTATAARELAGASMSHTEEEAFLGGLLQDIGVMVLAHCFSELYAPVLKETKDALAPSVDIERQHLGTDHLEVARLLFNQWHLPPPLSIPVLYHHSPENAERADEQVALAIRIQHLAGRLGEWLYTKEGDTESLVELKDLASRYFDISSEELEALMHRVDQKAEENAGLFEITAPRPETYSNLLQKANLALGDIVGEQELLVKELELAKTESQKLSEQLRIANNKLLDDVQKDPLTNLANRRLFEAFLSRELERCARYDHPLALLFIDIDDFKLINDTHGHLEGDAALKQVAGILSNQVRKSDLIARYGGEEFVAGLVETREEEAMTTAQRIRCAIEEAGFYLNDANPSAHLTVSIGLVVWCPKGKSVSAKALIAKADEAMYEAKKSGKNNVTVQQF